MVRIRETDTQMLLDNPIVNGVLNKMLEWERNKKFVKENQLFVSKELDLHPISNRFKDIVEYSDLESIVAYSKILDLYIKSVPQMIPKIIDRTAYAMRSDNLSALGPSSPMNLERIATALTNYYNDKEKKGKIKFNDLDFLIYGGSARFIFKFSERQKRLADEYIYKTNSPQELAKNVVRTESERREELPSSKNKLKSL